MNYNKLNKLSKDVPNLIFNLYFSWSHYQK